MSTLKQWTGVVGAALVATGAAGLAFGETGDNSLSSAPTRDVAIPFANRGGIRDWQADRDRGLWVQDIHGKWYYAKFMGPCTGLDFAQTIGFDTKPIGTFDRFSAIVVPRGQRCMVQSLDVSGRPPGRHDKHKHEADAAAPAKEG